jgi:hypothetical protein
MVAAPTIFGRPMTIVSAGASGKKTELIQDGGMMKRQKDIFHIHCGPRQIHFISHPPNPLCFQFVNTLSHDNSNKGKRN